MFQITTDDIGRYARRISTGEVGRIVCDPGNAWLHPSFYYEWQRIGLGDLEWVDVVPAEPDMMQAARASKDALKRARKARWEANAEQPDADGFSSYKPT